MVPEWVEVVRNVRVLVIYYVEICHMIVRSRLSMQLVLSSKKSRQTIFMFFSCLKCPAICESWHSLVIWVWSSTLFGINNQFL